MESQTFEDFGNEFFNSCSSGCRLFGAREMKVVAPLTARCKSHESFLEGRIFVEFLNEFLGKFQFVFLFEFDFRTARFYVDGFLDVFNDDGLLINDLLG